MKLIALMLLLVAGSVQAQTQEHGFLVKLDLDYKTAAHSFRTHGEHIISEDRKEFTTLTSPVDGVVLLGKLTPDGDSVRINYMIVDTKTSPAGLLTMAVLIPMNKPGKIESVSGTDDVTVEATVSPVNYTSSAN